MKILVVDDNETFLTAVCWWIAPQPKIDLVGTAGSGEEAIEAVDRLGPDLVLMDAVMPGINGFEATREIKSRPGAPLVVMMTMFLSQAIRDEAFLAGADGVVAKSEIIDGFAPLLETLSGGESRPRRRPASRAHPEGSDS